MSDAIKLFGIILIVFSGWQIGMLMSGRVKNHCECLHTIVKMLDEIEIMLKFNRCTFSELIACLKSSDEFKRLGLFENAEGNDIKYSVSQNIESLSLNLTADQIKNLQGFFGDLGMTDMDGQLSNINRCRSYFQREFEFCEKESREKSKLYISLGLLGGAFLAVILI